jgi:hypothetical protein
MERRIFFAASLLFGLSACGGTTVDNNTGGSSTTAGPSGTTGSATSSSSGTTSAGSTVTLTMDSFTVPAGGEVYYCQNFGNPFGGMDTQVSEFESHMSTGSHHLLLFYESPGDTNYEPPTTAKGALATCSGLEFAATPYGSQTQDDSLSFPTGVAALLPGANSLRIQSHYLNTTTSTVTANVELIFHLAAPGSVQNEAGVLFVVDPNFSIAPNSSAVVSDDCTIPQDMNVLRASSHMHMHGTDFVATVAGNTVYQTTAWSDPKPALFTPPTALHAGDPLHFACSFTNNTADTLTFGESALTNEMCIFTASFYPTPTGTATIDASKCKTSQQ